jgi:muconate cycloisomerase
MKITRLQRTPICVPFLPGILPSPEFEEFNTAYPQSIGKRRQDVLRIHTDEGLVGIGMTMPYYGSGGNEPADLVGRDPLEFEPRNLGGQGYQIALLDLIGKAVEWPLCRIFGGKLQHRVLVDYWISRMSPQASAAAAAAKRAHAQGFKGIKMKCAAKDHNVVDRALAVHEAAPDLRIVLDPNERFETLEISLDLARKLEHLDIVFEDPFPKTNWDEYRSLKENADVIVAPHLQRPAQVIEAISHRAVDAINIAPSDWRFLDMARIADAVDLPVWQASNVDLGIFDAFRLHASAAVPNCTLGSDLCGNFVHEHSLLKHPLVKEGYAEVPDGPGLGIELDEDAIEKYRVSEDTNC